MSTVPTQQRLDGRRSQQAFDAFLHSLAEPGTVHDLDTEVLAAGVPSVALLALTLADVETVVSVDGDIEHPVATAVATTTGARAGEAEHAQFVMLTAPDRDVVLRCDPGSALAPERGTRLAVRATHVSDTPNAGDLALDLSGPGVPGTRRLGLGGISSAFVTTLAAANRHFPAGIDTWFVTDDGAVAAIPRSTTVIIHEED